MRYLLTEDDIQKISEDIVENFRQKGKKEGNQEVYGKVMDALQQMIPHQIKKQAEEVDDNFKTSSITPITERSSKMSEEREELIFASSDEALQHLADITGKQIKVAAGNKSTFPCPDCGTKVLENTKYCVKCKKKVSKE